METIGLIAGADKFPLIFAKCAKEEKVKIKAIAIRGVTSGKIEEFVDKLYWINLGELKKLYQILIEERIKKVVMAGSVPKIEIFRNNIVMDEELKFLLKNVKDKKDESLLLYIANKLEEKGIKLLDSILFLSKFLAPFGVITKKGPQESDLKDIKFGKNIAKKIAALDIGQTVIVKEKSVIAVEAIEGTDEAIKRAGRLSKGCIVVKVSRPKQDMRFDVPVIGPETVNSLEKAEASCLAIEADKTLIIDKKETISQADKAGLCIIGI